jgi:hypothetical protein
MAVSVIQRTLLGNAAASATIAKAYAGNLTAGNASIAIGVTNGTAAAMSGCTGSQGKIYNLVATISTSNFKYKVFIAYNMSAAGETVTLTTGLNNSNLFIFEASGLAPYEAYDKSVNASTSSATSLTSGISNDYVWPNNLLIGITANTPNPGLAPTVGAGFSNAQTLTTAFCGGGSEEQIVSSRTGIAATFGLAANAANEDTLLFAFADTPIAQLPNNYQFFRGASGMWFGEKIR